METNEVESLLLSVEKTMTDEKIVAESTTDTDAETTEEPTEKIIRVRGLPWSTKEKDVRDFFAECENIGVIHFTYSKEGRPTGEAYIEFSSDDDVAKALEKHKESLGQRYIEVFLSKREEMDFVLKRSGRHDESPSDTSTPVNPDSDVETVVRLRGLPFQCTKEDILNFFSGLQVAPDGIVYSSQQRTAPGFRPGAAGKRSAKPGEAYVRFNDKETTERALERHMNKIGHRYIEVFRSSVDEMQQMSGGRQPLLAGAFDRKGLRPGPYSSPVITSGPVPLASLTFPDFPEFGGNSDRGGSKWENNGNGSRRGNRGAAQNRGAGNRFTNTGRNVPSLMSMNDWGDSFPPQSDYDSGDGSGGFYVPPTRPFSPLLPEPGGNGFFSNRPFQSSDSSGGFTSYPSQPNYEGNTGGGYSQQNTFDAGSGGGGGMGRAAGHVIHMRGLPFKATANDIMEILFDQRTGRPSGEADVDFYGHQDATEAMKKDKQSMGGRYIELFLKARSSQSAATPPPSYGKKFKNGPENTDFLNYNTQGQRPPNFGQPPQPQPLIGYPGFNVYDYGHTSGVPMPPDNAGAGGPIDYNHANYSYGQ